MAPHLPAAAYWSTKPTGCRSWPASSSSAGVPYTFRAFFEFVPVLEQPSGEMIVGSFSSRHSEQHNRAQSRSKSSGI
jgi:hypothetical protein